MTEFALLNPLEYTKKRPGKSSKIIKALVWRATPYYIRVRAVKIIDHKLAPIAELAVLIALSEYLHYMQFIHLAEVVTIDGEGDCQGEFLWKVKQGPEE